MDWSGVRLPGVDKESVVVVLGGGGAIGQEAVRAFAAAGATTVLVTRSAERSAALAAEIEGPGRVLGLAADLAEDTKVEEGELGGKQFVVSFSSGGRLTGVLCVNWPNRIGRWRPKILAAAAE